MLVLLLQNSVHAIALLCCDWSVACRQNLELFKARDVMQAPVITITPRESLAHIARLLLETTHGGFPVVTHYEPAGCEVAYGLLTRSGRLEVIVGC